MTLTTQPNWQDPRPCWHCHWFGYLMAENPHGQCQKPTNVPMITRPAQGCAFWRREPGVDDGGAPAPLHPDDPARRGFDRERERLVKITALGERANLKGMNLYPECIDRTGILVLGNHLLRGDDAAQADAAIERLGVNAAIRAGRL
ncbi:hypothetical protein ACFJIX_18060 [Roseateles sp. UC29_93]|uniref:hypothetical protein n=1 Tax=Roseateles sp. UC29_93 TaxID=3350177 RepID=UPI00367184BB